MRILIQTKCESKMPLLESCSLIYLNIVAFLISDILMVDILIRIIF